MTQRKSINQPVTADQVWERLRTIDDPELKINIVDLGLVYKVKVKRQKSKGKVYILMTPTTPGCPLAGMFDVLIKHALKKLPGIDVDRDVHIELTFDPPWTAEMMSEAAKAELGW